MMKLLTFACWIASLLVLASLVAFERPVSGWPSLLISGYTQARDALPVGLSAIWRDLVAFYLLFGVVEKSVTEWAYDYAGLVAKYKSRKASAKAGRALAAVSGVLLWPVSIALDVIAVLVWHSEAGDVARQASQQTLRSLRMGLSREEVEDVVSRYGRLTYMARPLFVCALCLSYVLIMIGLFTLV